MPDPRADGIAWRRVALGAAVTVALSVGAHVVVTLVAGGAGPGVARSWAGAYIVALVFAFGTGGAIVGGAAYGRTLPGAAAAGGLAAGLLALISLIAGRGGRLGEIGLGVAAGVLLAAIGGFVGEWLTKRGGREGR